MGCGRKGNGNAETLERKKNNHFLHLYISQLN